MFTLVSLDCKSISKALAQYVFNLHEAPNERRLSSLRVSRLKEKIQAGLTKPFDWAIISINGKEYRVNGKHSSATILHEFDGNVDGVVSLARYVGDSLKDVSDLWSQYDSQISMRTKSELLSCGAGCDPDLVRVTKKVLQTCEQAVSMWVYGEKGNTTPTPDDKVRLVQEHKTFVLWADSVFRRTNPQLWKKTGVIYAGLYTYQENPKQAKEFWVEMLSGENPDPQSPTRVLREALLQSVSLNKRSWGKTSFSWDEFADICLSAWESWKKGSRISRLQRSRTGLFRFVNHHEPKQISHPISESDTSNREAA